MSLSASPLKSVFIGLVLASAIAGTNENASGQTVWFVDAGAGGGNNGTSWADAFTDLQAGLAATSGNDEIWVANGTYEPTGGSDRTASFQLLDGVAIYGGFPTGGGDGTFEARDPDPETNGTVLSGDIDNDGILDGDNSYHVVTGSGTNSTAVLDGFTITGGYANGSGGTPPATGGGMFNDSGSPTVSNCIFTDNWSDSGGSGMRNDNGSNPTVTDCKFILNDAGDDGAGMANASSSPIVTNCIFDRNTGGITDPNWGGGAMANWSSHPTVTACTFTGNVSQMASGGAIGNMSSNPTLTDCKFIGNTATGGGGMYCDASDPTLEGCTFVESTGTAIQAMSGSNVLISQCNFVHNDSLMFLHGGSQVTAVNSVFSANMESLFVDNNSGVTATNCLFVGNDGANEGGAIACRAGGAATLWNCTISANDANSSGGGVMIETDGPAASLVAGNCIFWGNTDGNGANMDASAQITVQAGNSATVTYSDIQDLDPDDGSIPFCDPNCGGTENNNIDDDPLFFGGPSATWTAAATYDADAGQTTLIDGNASFTVDELAGKFLNPDTSQRLQSLIISNTATEIVVWGDFSAEGTSGAVYQINDYRLSDPSPCIDTADDTAVPGGVLTDLDNRCRFLDGDGDTIPTVDMGAYEFGDSPDCNGNGLCDEEDLSSGTSLDCNNNGIPDECDPDCNANGVPDDCDVDPLDPDGNGQVSADCQPDGIPDECQLGGPVTLLAADFEAGLPAGWTAGGLWHVTDQCVVPTACDPAQWAYFGDDGTCDFDIGAQAAGSLDAVAVAIPANAASVTLSYCSAYHGERGRAPDGFDAAWVAANGDVADDVGFTTTLLGEWEPRLVDLSAYSGQTVTLAWHFDSIDAINNAMLGWQVDQIELSVVINNDCNGNTIPDDCDIADLTSTDVNGNGIPDECEPDVRIVPVAVIVDPATTSSVRNAEPTAVPSVSRGSTYWIEIWAGDVGDENTGLTSVYTDVSFCAETSALSVDHGSIFTTFPSGTILAGGVDEFGGSALPNGGGIEPQWVRVGWVEMQAESEAASCPIVLTPADMGVAAFERGLIPPELVQFGSGDLEITQPTRPYDLDGDGFIGVGDLSLYAGSWQMTVPPGAEEHDFDCDSFVGVGDLSWFATGWQKFTTDPTIQYPPCPGRSGGGGRAGDPDADLRLIVLDVPSGSDTTTTLPASLEMLDAGQTFYLEVWVSDTGGLNTGLTSAYVDLTFPLDAASVTSVDHAGIYTLFPAGLVAPGVIDELGGSVLPGGEGIEPQWARVAVVEMQADAAPPSMTFHLLAGSMGLASYGRGVVEWPDVSLDSVTVSMDLIPGDIDGDGDIDSDDLDAFVAVLLGQPLLEEHVLRADLNGDGSGDGLDIQWFVDAFVGP